MKIKTKRGPRRIRNQRVAVTETVTKEMTMWDFAMFEGRELKIDVTTVTFPSNERRFI